MISSSKIASAVRLTMRDDFAVGPHTYSDAELLDAINRAIKYCGTLVPAMTVKSENISLVAGAVQTVPNDARLYQIWNNALDASYTETVGVRRLDGVSIPQQVAPSFIESQLRSNPARKRLVYMVAQYPDAPSKFLVFPANDGQGKLCISYRMELPVLAALADNDLDITNLLEGALTSYAVFVLLTRDGNDSPLAADGNAYLEACNAQIAALQPDAFPNK